MRTMCLILAASASLFLAGSSFAETSSSVKFKEENPDAYLLASGIQYAVMQKSSGGGVQPRANSEVTVHYRGSVASTGVEFDSSYTRGTPATFKLNQVIEGWQDALVRMRVGETWKVYIPAEKAYGSRGNGKVGPNEALVFEIQLINATTPDALTIGRFEKKPDGIHDSSQNLIWAEKDNGSTTDWAGAKAYCASLGAGWKLPSVQALQSLYDASGKYTFLWTQDGSEPTENQNDELLGPNYLNVNPATSLIKLSHCCFWSNEINQSSADGEMALLVDLGNGELLPNPTTYADGAQALCVRSGE